MDENPKEALAILEDASITDFDNEQDSLLYSLLLCQAKYKNYLPLTEDSLLSKAFQNFMKENDVLKKLEELGIEDGDTVRIYGHEFDYYK